MGEPVRAGPAPAERVSKEHGPAEPVPSTIGTSRSSSAGDCTQIPVWAGGPLEDRHFAADPAGGSARLPAWAAPPRPERHSEADAAEADSVIGNMERAFEMPFRDVRLRADGPAAARASGLGAVAYTDGAEIGFAAGAFHPHSRAGLLTIAHEFAHVVQMRGGTPGRQATTVAPQRGVAAGGPVWPRSADSPGGGEAAEAEAEQAAEEVVEGGHPAVDGIEAADGVLGRKPPVLPTAGAEVELGQGQARHYVDSQGNDHYVFRLEDVKAWGPEFQFQSMRHYFLGHFDMSRVQDREDLVRAFIAAYPMTISSNISLGGRPTILPESGGSSAAKRQKTYDLRFLPDVPSKALEWVRLNHPEVTPMTREALFGETSQISTFEPKGDMVLKPRPVSKAGGPPRYVAGSDSSLTASVHFDPAVFERGILNYFPSRADFHWRVMQGGKEVDSGPRLRAGAISYSVDLPDPGLYTIEVRVTSPWFADDRALNLSATVQAEKESKRAEDVFTETTAAGGKDQPFTKTATGGLGIKPGTEPHDIADQIFEATATLAAIDRLLQRKEIDADQAKEQKEFLQRELDGLKDAQNQLGDERADSYLIDGIFLNRQDSTSVRVAAFMKRTTRLARNGFAFYKITMFDLTLSPGEPIRHIGEAWAPLDDRPQPAVFAELEDRALAGIADHIHRHNDYPYGTMQLGVGLLEKPGTVKKLTADTYNWKRTAAKVAGGVAAVGGVLLIAAGAFTGGASAGVGVWILEGVTVASGISVAAYNINERLEKGRSAFDSQLVLDLMAFVPVFGALGKALGASKLLLNGMSVMALAGTTIALRQETINALLGIDAHYNVNKDALLTKLDAAKASGDSGQIEDLNKQLRALDHSRDEQRAQVIGSAAVSGGMVLIQFGTTIAAGAGGRAPEVPETRTPTTPEPGAPAPGQVPSPPTEPVPPPPTPTPVTPEATKPVTPEPAKPVTPEPTKPVTPEPAKPVTPEPAKPVTPEPAKPVTPEPAKPVTPEPTKPVTPEPTKPVTPEPTKPVTPEPTKPVTPEPTPSEQAPSPPVEQVPPKPATTPTEAMQAKITELQTKRAALVKKLSALRARQRPVQEQLQAEMGKQHRQLKALQEKLGRATDPQTKADVQKQIDATQEAWDANNEKLQDFDADVRNLQDEINGVDHEVDKARFPLARDPQDVEVSGTQPEEAMPTTGRRVGDTPNQQAQLEHDLKNLPEGAKDVRVNQWQVDADGKVQGINRPDLQYTVNGKRFYIEYEQPSNPRGLSHAQRILRNDPTGTVTVKLVPKTAGFVPGQDVQVLPNYTLDNITLY
jgi:hypothetical protein